MGGWGSFVIIRVAQAWRSQFQASGVLYVVKPVCVCVWQKIEIADSTLKLVLMMTKTHFSYCEHKLRPVQPITTNTKSPLDTNIS